ncbi:MAG: hypothetical protein IKP23_06205 [Elusimicrobiaceae bacterium]|nr:hypothetical protein [Elusimicrobiaceae bacterium]
MKKTLALLLAAAFAVPAFAGNVLSNVETYGEIETIGIAQTEAAGAKSVANQTLFGISADLVEDVRANLTFAYNNAWENRIGETIYDGSGDSYLENIRVAEANVVVSNIFGALETKIGRQYYGNEDSAVMYIGPRHNYYANLTAPWSQMSLDGALLTYRGESLNASAFYAQMVDMTDERMTGLTLDYAFTNNLVAGAYWYDFSDEDHEGIWGGRVAYQNEGSKLAVEGAKNYENGVFSHNNVGWMLKADAALNLDMEKVALTPRITYYHSEKEFFAAGNYTAGLLLGNAAGAFSINGEDWKVLNAGIDFGVKALEKVTFAFDYVNAKVNNEWLGNEFDLTAKYQHNDYVTFTLGGGILTNAAENNSTIPLDGSDIYVGQLGMLIKF